MEAVWLSWLERLPRERSYDLDVRGFESRACMPTDLQKLMPALSVSVTHRCFQSVSVGVNSVGKHSVPRIGRKMEVPCIGEPQPMHVKTNTLVVKEKGVNPVYCICMSPIYLFIYLLKHIYTGWAN